MSFQASNKTQDIRPTAEFSPSIWGDHFLSFVTNSKGTDERMRQQAEELKEQVRRILMDMRNTHPQKLDFIDAVQRLGVSYHFETEIEEALEQIHRTHNLDNGSSDLYSVALEFRLLRQQGYRVSSGVFNQFKDNIGEFKESLVSDVRGMLGLYEATHLRVHGEEVLEQALAFTTTNLKRISALSSESVSDPLAAQVSYALRQPLHKGIQRLEQRYYIDTYQEQPSHNPLLLSFAKLDFNILQKMHQKELGELTRWWKDLDLKTKLPYARDRLVECYLWMLFVFYEPRHALGRKMLTKVAAMISILDDTYDNYGTIKELDLLTKAIQRWDIAKLDQLPKYMQVSYTALLNLYSEIEEEMENEGKSYAVNYAKEAMKGLVRAYFQEAKWFNEQYTPTTEEYMSVALVTSTQLLLTLVSFLGMGDVATRDAFEWLVGDPKILKGSAIICRLMDDIASHEFEQKRGHVASIIECHMKQHDTEEVDAIKAMNELVMDAWKDINQDCLKPIAVPMPLLTRMVNFSRIIHVFYKDDDGYTNADIVIKDFVTIILVDSVLM